MKKLLVILTILVTSMSLFAKGRTDLGDKYVEETGVIQMYGNMPFSYPGLVTEDGKKYTLKTTSEKTENKIKDLVGRRVTVIGVVDIPVSEDGQEIKAFQMLKDGFLWVDEIERVKTKKK